MATTRRKPVLTLLAGDQRLDLDALARLYRKLTGRDPTPEEIKRAQVRLDAARSDAPVAPPAIGAAHAGYLPLQDAPGAFVHIE